MVRIGAYTNVQDGAVITEAFEPLGHDHDGSTIIGHYCSIGPNVTMRACTIEDEVIIGAGSVLDRPPGQVRPRSYRPRAPVDHPQRCEPLRGPRRGLQGDVLP